MEEPDSPFFYAARSFGLNLVTLSLVDAPLLDWNGRIAYLAARAERERWTLYAYDLLWAAVKNRYDDLPMPSEIAKNKPIDRRTAEQIIDDLIKKASQT